MRIVYPTAPLYIPVADRARADNAVARSRAGGVRYSPAVFRIFVPQFLRIAAFEA
jgi:hypothetical protein